MRDGFQRLNGMGLSIFSEDHYIKWGLHDDGAVQEVLRSMTSAGEVWDVGISEFSHKYGWFARGDKVPEEIRVPFNRPSLGSSLGISYPTLFHILFICLPHELFVNLADQVDLCDKHVAQYQMDGFRGSVKCPHRVPHDLGNPAVEPRLCTNSYVTHDTSKWRDLNLKFILTCCRDYFCILNQDKGFLQKVWPTIKRLITEARVCWDQDDDGMIENSGTADQTYDAWKRDGFSNAYCGCLWLASLRAASRLASEIDDIKSANPYAELLSKAQESAKTIMADQLCGNWFLMSISPEIAHDVKETLLPLSHVKSTLDQIYNLNVLNFSGERLGADDIQRGFDTAWGCYDVCYNRFGLQYQTPEAIYEDRFYRAIGYMRPLSIWAIQWTLLRQFRVFDHDSTILSHINIGSSLGLKEISSSEVKKKSKLRKVPRVRKFPAFQKARILFEFFALSI
ncbi:unnamed protein product [Acanthocheilonema viteae]|uniref:Glycosyl-hydrolase family 116 catalytic region domain-containing protein n=1 Tax=Acanthocheilonema viteae TaxID=6277 RepID=A0A498S782_ACAVI|nr:unnamed protein product [Acanthocheilonema viteae]